jgi:hypothetical protein
LTSLSSYCFCLLVKLVFFISTHRPKNRVYLAPAIDRVWDDGIDSIRLDLREWLRRASEDDTGYVPWRFELSFGLADSSALRQQADRHSTPGPVELDCGIRLRGSIDLVERHAGGHIRISDHKTGKADGGDGQIIAGGKSLQPALYALVAEKLFGGTFKVDCGRLYFCTSAGGFAQVIVPLDPQARNSIAQVANIIPSPSIRNGAKSGCSIPRVRAPPRSTPNKLSAAC